MKDDHDTVTIWINAIFRPLVGFFLGVAAGLLIRQAVQVSWVVALISLLVLTAAYLVFEFANWQLDKMFERILPTGIRPARKPQKRLPAKTLIQKGARFGGFIGIAGGMTSVLTAPEAAMDAVL